MSNETTNTSRFDEAVAEALLFYGTETTLEELRTFLEIRFSDLSDEDRAIIAHTALSEN
jgi:hypothetical protein